MVGTMCRSDHVSVVQRGRGADGDGLLADARVDRPVHELLVFEQPLLRPAYDLELEQEAGTVGRSKPEVPWPLDAQDVLRKLVQGVGTHDHVAHWNHSLLAVVSLIAPAASTSIPQRSRDTTMRSSPR